MKINVINKQNFGKVIFKDNSRQYIMERVLPTAIESKDKNFLYDKFYKIAQSDDTDIIIEKTSGRHNDYILFSVTKNGKNVKGDFHYCLDTKENTQELLDTFHEILDFALYGKKRKA